ncbi:hypothetical protein ACJDU8_21640 [Clostridium sp. WILCCON 0269]|uniref:Transposase n=1 Tax=Candidatus Clostridium eludens TaxID=3381663 RepID=A0ABW8SQT2_9CLOT
MVKRRVNKISKVRKVKLRLHRKLTMKGLYYRELINRIYNPKNEKAIRQNNSTKQTHQATEIRLEKEEFFIDRYC